jgi:hypothetical protein
LILVETAKGALEPDPGSEQGGALIKAMKAAGQECHVGNKHIPKLNFHEP